MQKKRIPKQNRSIETKTRILEAGFSLFSQKGLHGTSSREIAAKAGVAIGSFYSYFKDKRDLFIVLLKTHRINVMKILNEYSSKTITDNNQFELIQNLVKTVWASHYATNEFDQKAEMLKNVDPEIDTIIKQQEEVVRSRITANLKLIKNRLRKKNIDVAAWLVSIAIREIIHSATRSTSKDMNLIIDELSDMISRYLFK
jgi:AcrR family transcriptional regulator